MPVHFIVMWFVLIVVTVFAVVDLQKMKEPGLTAVILIVFYLPLWLGMIDQTIRYLSQ